MFNLTIKNRLMIAFLAILIIPCASIGWFSYEKAKSAITSEIESNARQSAQFADYQINDLLSKSLIDMDYLAKPSK